MPTAEELQERIEQLRKEADALYTRFKSGDNPDKITYIRLEIVATALQLAEISTRRIVRLTWGLFGLTLALLVVSIVTLAVIFKQDAAALSRHSPAAAEVFELRSKCAMLGKKLLGNNIVGSDSRQSQVSHYDPKIKRCFVQLTVQSADLFKPPDKLDRYLYDGQTAELLAFAGIEKGVKSGMIFKKGSAGFEEASSYIDEKMKDDSVGAMP